MKTQVKDYSLYLNGHYVREATLVEFEDGQIVKFIEKMPKKDAIKQAQRQRCDNRCASDLDCRNLD